MTRRWRSSSCRRAEVSGEVSARGEEEVVGGGGVEGQIGGGKGEKFEKGKTKKKKQEWSFES